LPPPNKNLPKPPQKIIFTTSFLVFTGHDERCRLLPVIEFSQSSFRIEDFIPKSMEIEGNCKESLQFQEWAYSLIKSNLLGRSAKLLSGNFTFWAFLEISEFDKNHMILRAYKVT
jgi:hypothetical protein